MMVVMLFAGIGLVLAGLLATVYGISIKEFSTGNTLITAGVMGVCTGAIMLALWVAVRELKAVARRLGNGMTEPRGEAAIRPVLPPRAMQDPVSGGGIFPSSRDQPPVPPASSPAPPVPPPPPPWQDETVLRDHPIPEPMHPEDAGPSSNSAPKPKRNLLFSSTSRRERERGQARVGEPLPLDLLSSDLRSKPPAVPPPVEPAELPPASFEDAWPKAERARPSEMLRRGGRTPAFPEADAGPMRSEDQPEVTVLKSGIVDGMAYSLYSDGSIEAQMPEGMMRFASIDELRAHLDQRS